MTSYRYKTIESSRDVWVGLHQDISDEFYTCEIKMALPRADTVEDKVLTIELKRLTQSEPNFTTANGDLIYRTVGRWPGSSEEFPVDAIIRSSQSDTGATLSLARVAGMAFSGLTPEEISNITRPIGQ